MIQLANFEEREFFVVLGKVVTSVDIEFTFQMTEQVFTATLAPTTSTLRASKFRFTASNYPEGQYIAKITDPNDNDKELATVVCFVAGNPVFATSQYNTYNDDGTSTTYVPSADQGLVPSVSQRLRVNTLDEATDVSYVRQIQVSNGTLTDDGSGTITIDTGGGGAEAINDLTDVNIINPSQGDVLSYNSGVQRWMVNGGLQDLLQRFKASGTGAQMYDTLNDTTKGYVDVLANSATMKVNVTGMNIREASPGIITLSVAAGTEGAEVQFDAVILTGSDSVTDSADWEFQTGTNTYFKNDSGRIWLRVPDAGDITVLLPSNAGTLALLTDISKDAAVVANTAKNSYPSADATKLAGIAAGAEVNVNADWNATTGDAQILNKPTIPDAVWTTSGDDIYYTTGNVGIGTTTPSQPLHVVGDIKADGGYIDFRESGGGLVHIQTHTGNTKLSIGTLTNPADRQVAIGHVLGSKFNSVQIGGRDVGGGTSSVAIGDSAMENNTNSTNNIGIGQNSHRFGGGSNAVAIGNSAMYGNGPGTGGNSVAVGHLAMGYGAGADSVGIGYEANRFSGSSNNVVVGYQAAKGVSGTSTFANTVAVGYQALTALTTGDSNTALGYQASYSNTTGSRNLSFGHQTNYAVTTGSYNTGVGWQANRFAVTTNHNTGVGYLANSRSTGSNNTAIGSEAAEGVIGTSTFSNTVAVGYQALTALTTGANNTAVGFKALAANTTGYSNTSVGYQAGDAITTGNRNVLVGDSAGGSLTSSAGFTFVGFEAGRDQTSGGQNTYFGFQAGYTHVGHSQQTMIGFQARNTKGSGNAGVAIGAYATIYGSNQVAVGGSAQTTDGGTALGPGARAGSYATAVGNGAGSYQKKNSYSVHVGRDSGQDGKYSVALGVYALRAATESSYYNVAVGNDAGYSLTSGGSNILIGYQAGYNLTTESNKLYIENSNSTTPLIYGEFDNDIVKVNGQLEVTEGITVNKTADTDFSYNGDVMYFGSGSTTQGELCYLNSSGGWTAADADAASSSGGVMLAIALGTDPDADGMLLKGTFTLNYDAGTIGDELYVSTTAGDITSTAPSGSGDVVRVVGYCLDSTNGQIYFNPSSDWVELS